MREILFRGKRTDNGKWVIGMLCQYHEGVKAVIADNHFGTFEGASEVYVVIPETVGQFTGLTDKNGKRIFEGDVVRLYFVDTTEIGEIIWDEEWCKVAFLSEDGGKYGVDGTVEFEVIGNIHDELLKGKSE